MEDSLALARLTLPQMSKVVMLLIDGGGINQNIEPESFGTRAGARISAVQRTPQALFSDGGSQQLKAPSSYEFLGLTCQGIASRPTFPAQC